MPGKAGSRLVNVQTDRSETAQQAKVVAAFMKVVHG